MNALKVPPWHVYIVRCADDTLYTGIARDLARRVAEHNAGKAAARYTRSRRPVVLVYYEPAASRSAAAKREYEIKCLRREEKQLMVEAMRKAKLHQNLAR